jgi:fructose-specific phosphotransferase system IIC component
MEFGFGLVLGFLAGYLVREFISRRRHLQARQRRRMGLDA